MKVTFAKEKAAAAAAAAKHVDVDEIVGTSRVSGCRTVQYTIASTMHVEPL